MHALLHEFESKPENSFDTVPIKAHENIARITPNEMVAELKLHGSWKHFFSRIGSRSKRQSLRRLITIPHFELLCIVHLGE